MNPLDDPKVKQQFQVLGYTKILGYVLLLVGCAVLAWNAGWWITIGIVLMFAGNNAASNANVGLALMKVTSLMLETFEMAPKQRNCVDEAAELLKRAHAELNGRR